MKLRMSVPGHERSEAAKVLYSRASPVPRKRRSVVKMRSAAWGHRRQGQLHGQLITWQADTTHARDGEYG